VASNSCVCHGKLFLPILKCIVKLANIKEGGGVGCYIVRMPDKTGCSATLRVHQCRK
jgi:hypothetical protein